MDDGEVLGRRLSGASLHLPQTAIRKQVRVGDVAAVVGREKQDRLRDLARCAESAERDAAGDHLRALARRRGRRAVARPAYRWSQGSPCRFIYVLQC